jgi:hypothetical protein
MITRIVFAGGAEVEVPLGVEQVRDALQQDGEAGRLSAFELTQHDRSGGPLRIYINRDHVAFIMDAELAEPPLADPSDDQSRGDSSPAGPETRAQRLTDMWGNPIRPRRRGR